MENNKFIGISENRAKHMLAVARKAYEIAKAERYDEKFCRKMFLIGYIHDIGYEFSTKQEDHPFISMEMIMSLSENRSIDDVVYYAIAKHGCYTDKKTDEWKILNIADMLIDENGNETSVTKRLDGIKEKYGENSNQYLTACDICYQIGLTAINLAKNKT